MKTIDGDLIKLAISGEFDIIIHGCNCFHTMSDGIAKQISEEFPEAYEIDKRTGYGDLDKMGKISSVVTRGVRIINAYIQFNPGTENDSILYDSIEKCFKQIAFLFQGKRIGIPKIGSGIVGGDWETIENIISEIMKYNDVTVVDFKG